MRAGQRIDDICTEIIGRGRSELVETLELEREIVSQIAVCLCGGVLVVAGAAVVQRV